MVDHKDHKHVAHYFATGDVVKDFGCMGSSCSCLLHYIGHLKIHLNVYTLQFLGDTFNALFAIMEEMAEEVGDLVFEALVSTLLCSL